MKAERIFELFVVTWLLGMGQTVSAADFNLALPQHQGQLSWSADGFKTVQMSAKAEGREIGIRGQNASGQITFLGFLFLFPEQAPMTSAKCSEGVLGPAKKANSTLKILATSEVNSPGNLPISITSYSARAGDGKTAYSVRGFVATGDICGDLELYSNSSIAGEDSMVKTIFASYRFDPTYSPQFDSALLYAQVLYQAQMYKAAGPMFEVALIKIKENPVLATRMMKDEKTARRVVTDQAGMSFGMSGDIQKARSLFEKGIAEDPDYPMYYYNLACADAEEKNLGAAKGHLQQAFARKANVVSGESIPDPTKDDSFLPYRDNKEFWAFLEGLPAK